jgi:AcrR family transcriptional regulator
MRNPENTKVAILDAAKCIVIEDGVAGFTIDEVAKRAAVSKGGVLYHYPSKEALLLAVLKREMDGFGEYIERLRRQDPVSQGAYTRAYLRACVEEVEDCERGTSEETIPCLEGFRSIPTAQELVRSYVNRWQQQVQDDGLDPAFAALVRYAGDGIWMASRAGCDKPAAFDAVVRKLFELASAPSPMVKQRQETS